MTEYTRKTLCGSVKRMLRENGYTISAWKDMGIDSDRVDIRHVEKDIHVNVKPDLVKYFTVWTDEETVLLLCKNDTGIYFYKDGSVSIWTF